MKKTIKAVSVLCGGLLFISPLTNMIFAQNTSNKPEIELVKSIDENKKETIKNEDNIVKQNIEVKPQYEYDFKENEAELKSTNSQINNEATETIDVVTEEKNEVIENTEKNEIVEDTVVEDKIEELDKNTVEVINVLNQEQAKELLEMYHKDVDYMFQGDEKSFEALTQKGLSGYVFLPDYETDLGFFVDKNTAGIYYFHPSGYLESAL